MPCEPFWPGGGAFSIRPGRCQAVRRPRLQSLV